MRGCERVGWYSWSYWGLSIRARESKRVGERCRKAPIRREQSQIRSIEEELVSFSGRRDWQGSSSKEVTG